MSYRLLTTVNHKNIYCVLVDEKDKLIEVNIEDYYHAGIIGNIYIGKVTNFVKGHNIAFVDIGFEKDVFLQLNYKNKYLYTNNKDSEDRLRIGDDIIVEVTKEAYMKKPPTVTGNVSISGKYCVLTFNKAFVGVSAKIDDEYERKRLKRIFKPYITDYYGFIVRTNSKYVDDYMLIDEIEQLREQFNQLVNAATYKKSFSCLLEQPPIYMQMIRDLYHAEIEEYVFDNKEIYGEVIKEFDKDIRDKTRFVETNNYNLYKLFSLESKIEEAVSKRVFLKSGANIVIEYTEALTVIDVNSAKSSSKKKTEKAIYDVNKEAAFEIGRQLRLRNISGIIIVDFIDMTRDSNNQKLIKLLKEICDQDRTKTTVVDMTTLGLVELTRKKTGVKLIDKMKKIRE